MRFVGGKISKNEDGVTIKTPAGALAIRGGMAQGNGKVWSFLYGTAMTFKGNNGKTYTVYEPGYTLDLTGGTPTIRPTRPEDINVVMAALTNGSTSGLGSSGDQTPPTNPSNTQGLESNGNRYRQRRHRRRRSRTRFKTSRTSRSSSKRETTRLRLVRDRTAVLLHHLRRRSRHPLMCAC